MTSDDSAPGGQRRRVAGGRRALTRMWALAGLIALGGGAPSSALDVLDAVRLVIETHPEIVRAAANKQAVEFELDAARGRYLPSLDVEARSGLSYRDGDSDNASGAEEDVIAGWRTRAVLAQPVFDGGEIDSEVERQGYRIDGAALRVLERAEFLGLEAVRVYADVLRLQELQALAEDNLRYHRAKAAEIAQAVDVGVFGPADGQQARERMLAAEDQVSLAALDVQNARIAFLETVGVDAAGLSRLPAIGAELPATLDEALAEARRINPRMRFAQADIGAAEARYRAARARLLPQVTLEGDVSAGENIDGFRGRDTGASVGLVLRYQFNGGIDSANRQEQLRRVSESRAQLHEQARFVEQEVRASWALLESQRLRRPLLARQARSARELLALYEQEFDVGARTLLDLLNTRNALFQAELDAASAVYVERFAEYRLMASIGALLPALDIAPPVDAASYGAQETGAPPVGALSDARRSDPWTTRSRLFDARDWR
jgi:adhesin transport system outer membrane protein